MLIFYIDIQSSYVFIISSAAEEGDVRLEQSRGMGRLDVYHAGEWAGVCRENFDTNAAKVIIIATK